MRDTVFTIVGNVLSVPADTLHEEASPETIKTWDSLKHMSLVLALEEAFDMEFTDVQIAEMTTVKSILNLVGAKAA